MDYWRRYPFELVHGDSQFCFPAAEGQHPDCESDTWFLAGELTGQSGRRFAFLTIFNKNRPGHAVVADFYTFALFDLDSGTYGTYTDYDMPPASMQRASPKLSAAQGCLDIGYQSGAGEAVWRTCGEPFAYDVALVGADSAGEPMALRLNVTPTRAPVPLGGPIYHGKIACFGQDDTYSYFQTGMTMTGKLQWGSVAENVSGTAGHVDRQWFPRYAGGGGTDGDPRARAHEWRTIHLDNGVDLSVWRQFDRANHNALQLFSGATTSPPVGEPEFADDIEVDVTSYVRWPEEVRPLVPPLAAARYMPDRHRIRSRQLGLDLTGEPLVAAPAHALPIEYMEGPYRYQGTLAGKPVNGSAFYERSLALYRDWELVDVLATVIDVGELRSLIREGRRDEAVEYLADVDVHPLVDDLIAALHRSILELPGS